mgnify:CR=1 FL=1
MKDKKQTLETLVLNVENNVEELKKQIELTNARLNASFDAYEKKMEEIRQKYLV